MSSYYLSDALVDPHRFAAFEQQGLVSRTFIRLDPQRQTAIVRAIMEEATQKGPLAVNIKEVAKKAGVSVGSLYQYFGSRHQLLDFAIELVVSNTLAVFESAIPWLESQPINEALPVYLHAAEEWNLEQRGLFQFFLRTAYEGNPALQERVVQPVAICILNMTRRLVQAAVRRGELRPDLDEEAAIRLLNILLIGLGDSSLLPHLNTYYQAVDEKINAPCLIDTLLNLIRKA